MRPLFPVEVYQATPPAREHLSANQLIGRHRHVEGYVTIVVRGGYEETGHAGWSRVRAGDVLIHHPYDAHLNATAAGDVENINFALPKGWARHLTRGRLPDLDAALRTFERSPFELAELVADQIEPVEPEIRDWPDLLAQALRRDAGLRLGRWAASHGLDAATVSREFRRLYGVSPVRFRCEQRSTAALNAIAETAVPLAGLAQDLGFSDQAQMSRAIRKLTGCTPRSWRTQVKKIQDRTGSRA